MKFRIKIRGPGGDEWWEDEEREIGPQNYIRGAGQQPDFTGNIDQWGRDIIEWFNKIEPPERHRTFIKAELISNRKKNKKT
jgi:hypothetical protein